MSVFAATTGDEIGVATRWILDRLRTDTGPGGLRNTSSPAYVSGGIYETLAPQGSVPPYVEVAYLAGDVVAATNSADEIMVSLRFQVKAIVMGVDALPALPIGKRIHARLHKQGGIFATGTAIGEVLSCVRRAPVSYSEGAPDQPVRHHGHEYELLVQSA